MNSFNKTEAAVFSCRLFFLRAFPFISVLLAALGLMHLKNVLSEIPWVSWYN